MSFKLTFNQVTSLHKQPFTAWYCKKVYKSVYSVIFIYFMWFIYNFFFFFLRVGGVTCIWKMYMEKTILVMSLWGKPKPSITPTFFVCPFILFRQFRVTGGLNPIPTGIGWVAGHHIQICNRQLTWSYVKWWIRTEDHIAVRHKC